MKEESTIYLIRREHNNCKCLEYGLTRDVIFHFKEDQKITQNHLTILPSLGKQWIIYTLNCDK